MHQGVLVDRDLPQPYPSPHQPACVTEHSSALERGNDALWTNSLGVTLDKSSVKCECVMLYVLTTSLWLGIQTHFWSSKHPPVSRGFFFLPKFTKLWKSWMYRILSGTIIHTSWATLIDPSEIIYLEAEFDAYVVFVVVIHIVGCTDFTCLKTTKSKQL